MMTERMFELVSQARQIANYDPNAGYEPKIWANVCHSALIRLTIAECIEVLSTESDQFSAGPDITGVVTRAINKRFGIE